MEQYNVTGMSCAACSARVEKAVKKVPGVTSLLGEPADQLHGRGGHGQRRRPSSQRCRTPATAPAPEGAASNAAHSTMRRAETPWRTMRRPSLEAAAHRLAGLSAGADVLFHGTHDVGLAAARTGLTDNHVAMGLVQLLLTGIVMVINQKFFISGFKGLLARRAQHGHAGGPGLHGQPLCGAPTPSLP